ncbi:cysteine-rich PDZ-binding protein isoform X1 [Phoca vitulina]|uniref:cysteine-rich PDZ-binding protein isoform X1 n=1 Tax=Phoca vitulina TaxID=9720 RepID=UPI001395D71A|nr:cysteine-rich PDZ-binding protein isoform X1 [Phoca vitulina]
MVCEKCEKKLGTVITPDTWKDGARNTTESGGRKLNENKALTSKKARELPLKVKRSWRRDHIRHVSVVQQHLWVPQLGFRTRILPVHGGLQSSCGIFHQPFSVHHPTPCESLCRRHH